MQKEEKRAAEHTMCYSKEVIDKQDVLAVIDNYVGSILRQEANRNRMHDADLIEGLRQQIEKMPVVESIPVEYIYTKLQRIVKVKTAEAQRYASHIASIVVSWEREHVSEK